MKNKQKRLYISIACASIMMASTGCQGIPKDVLVLKPESLQKRSMQTRVYDKITDKELLSASAGVMQDLGFNIDESETKLGVVVASKERDATETGQVVGSILMAVLLGADTGYDTNQKLKISLVVRPKSENGNKQHFVKATFQRIVWNSKNRISKRETLDEPKMYQEFFDRLSKAVFLEGHKI